MIPRNRNDNTGFTRRATAVMLVGVGLMLVVAVSVWLWERQGPSTAPPSSPPLPQQPHVNKIAASEIQTLTANVRKYYDVDHKADSERFRWRVVDLSSDVQPMRPADGSCTGLIQYTIAPEHPATALGVGPTGHRLQLVYRGGRWVLTGVQMRLEYLEPLRASDWRDMPYSEQELKQISIERLGIKPAS